MSKVTNTVLMKGCFKPKPVAQTMDQFHPGDVIVADDDGVVVVARSEASAVAESGAVREQNEQEKREQFKSGHLGLDMYDMRGPLEAAGLVYVDSADDLDD